MSAVIFDKVKGKLDMTTKHYHLDSSLIILIKIKILIIYSQKSENICLKEFRFNFIYIFQ